MPSEQAFLTNKVYQAILGRFEPEHLHVAMDEHYETPVQNNQASTP